MLGDGRTRARPISELAVISGAVLVVPEHTRPPEARCPVALEEPSAALTWVADNEAAPVSTPSCATTRRPTRTATPSPESSSSTAASRRARPSSGTGVSNPQSSY
ncbi:MULTISPECIES: alpha/beta hydrolase fold domain-containing protein [Streptomyces]|uniref:alpha/beta hydrolase fold domain-containing protein n=1 Tax=Streptomyces TaxID=1883 RepID=UPI00099BF930|nr:MULTISPECIES: alpha/beta hydrolase fold domain-containing protein [Streptomyces]